jgi:hypothetical protein
MPPMIDSSKKRDGLPEYDLALRCQKHPGLFSTHGFGLAGGGYGPYTMCVKCGAVLSKTCLPDDEA